MLTNILQYLEQTATRFPDKVSFANEETGLTFRELHSKARSIGSFLVKEGFCNQPVVVLMKKHPKMLAAFFGVVYAGNSYVPLDDEMPRHRIELIFQTLKPQALICDESTAELVRSFDCGGKIYLYEQICDTEVDEQALAQIREQQLDTDPLYIVFTSGSTGVPKGVMACHRSVIDYIEHLSEAMDFDENTIFGNQTPLYFDASMKEVYPTIKCGATTYIIPKQLFMFPVKLVEYLNRFRINTVCWVASALTLVSSFRTFEKIKPEYLHTIGFSSEVFPIKQYNLWRQTLPNARYFNLYGPTEITGCCCYYEATRPFGDDEVMPIGKAFPNSGVFLLDEDNKIPPVGEIGEICVRGTGVALGYYRNPERTAEAFVQNPLNDMYPERIYRTGDLARLNEKGEFVFAGRKDYQIKHMGHRIELGEIEAVVNLHKDVQIACCLFNSESKKIFLYYSGEVSTKEMNAYIKEKLPRYMIPHVIAQLDALPRLPNGKLDRNLMKQMSAQSK